MPPVCCSGPGLQLLDPARQFGPGLRPIVGLAVAIVVFEGGLTLDFRELRTAGRGVVRLVTGGAALTLPLATCAAHWITGMSWAAAVLFGAIVIVTGPTVVLLFHLVNGGQSFPYKTVSTGRSASDT